MTTRKHKPARKTHDKNLISGLIKGIQIIEAFDSAHPSMTLSEAARRVGLTPATARRCLLTLCHAGYARTDGKRYWLNHGALNIAYAYTASTGLPRLLQPALDWLSERTRESTSLAVLHDTTIIIAARANARRSLTVGLTVGSRLPLHCSATGRVLMAALPPRSGDALLASLPLRPVTPFTDIDPESLRRRLQSCRQDGYATCDQELEIGVRSLAIPIFNDRGATLAALSISSRVDRMALPDMVQKLLPVLRRSQTWARLRLSLNPP